MTHSKCQWINAVIMCALALTQPMRAQSPISADSLSVTTPTQRSTNVSIQVTETPEEQTPKENPSEKENSSKMEKHSEKENTTTIEIIDEVNSQTLSSSAESSSEGSAPQTTSSPETKNQTVSTSTVNTESVSVTVSTYVETPKTASTQVANHQTSSASVENPQTLQNPSVTVPGVSYTSNTSNNSSVVSVPAQKSDSLNVNVPVVDEQSIFDPDSIITKMDIRMAQMDALIHRPSGKFASPEFLGWSASYTTDSLYLATLDKIAQTQASIIKAQSGIQLTGQTYYRPDAAFGIDDETDDVSRYVAKIQAEVRWYFLQSGIYNRHGRIEEINLKTDVERLEHLKNRAEPQLYANRERLRVRSDSILASVMLHRMINLDMLEQAYLYLLDNENISSDNLLRVLDDRAEAERRLSTISTAPTYAPTLAYVQAGTVTIDTMAIFETIYQTDINIKILDKKSMLLDQQASNTRWLNDVRVAPFARYSHYFRHNMAVSANVDVGISFTIPINAEASRKRRALLLEKGLIDSKRDEVETSAADRVRYIVNEVYRLNRSIAGEWRRAQSLKKYLRARREAYDRRQGEYNRLSALMEYNGYLKCLENIIEIQYRRDSQLADLQSMMPETPLDRYCAFIPLYTHE